jgi:radical SAM-linked protein
MRAKAPVKFSNGFNPHLVMTIGLPLSVGTTSECDVLDIELTQSVDKDIFMQSLNDTCPDGIRIINIKEAEGLKPLHMIDSAIYEAHFNTDAHIDMQKFFDVEEFLIEKKSKRGLNMVNIKDFIRNLEVVESHKKYGLKMHINAGNFSNLKPELVLKAMSEYLGFEPTDIEICRKKIFFDDGNEVM